MVPCFTTYYLRAWDCDRLGGQDTSEGDGYVAEASSKHFNDTYVARLYMYDSPKGQSRLKP